MQTYHYNEESDPRADDSGARKFDEADDFLHCRHPADCQNGRLTSLYIVSEDER